MHKVQGLHLNSERKPLKCYRTKQCTRVADRAFPDSKSLGRNRVIVVVRHAGIGCSNEHHLRDVDLISALGLMLRLGWVMLSNNRWVFRVSTRSALNNVYAVSTIPFATTIFAVVALFCFVMMLTSGMRQGQ